MVECYFFLGGEIRPQGQMQEKLGMQLLFLWWCCQFKNKPSGMSILWWNFLSGLSSSFIFEELILCGDSLLLWHPF